MTELVKEYVHTENSEIVGSIENEISNDVHIIKSKLS